jgi:Domain of unknown function (DUF4260)
MIREPSRRACARPNWPQKTPHAGLGRAYWENDMPRNEESQAPAVTGQPRMVLRIEGAALLLIAVVLFAGSKTSWWLFVGLILVPDLSIAAYLAGPCIGAAIYNAAHTIAVPVLIALSDLILGTTLGVPVALIWAAHIGADRMLGYGLKYERGFGFTHLGRIGAAKQV